MDRWSAVARFRRFGVIAVVAFAALAGPPGATTYAIPIPMPAIRNS